MTQNDASTRYNKGLAFGPLGRYNEALQCFDKSLKMTPEYPEALKCKDIALEKLREQCHLQIERRQEEEYEKEQTNNKAAEAMPKPSKTKLDIPSPILSSLEKGNSWLFDD